MEPVHKRKRIDSPTNRENPGPPGISRSTLWFDDGNIILQAESIIFRVHRSVLALHSPVLRDMFLLARPDMDIEPDFGCPLVRMEGDLGSEWEELLTLIYHGFSKTRPGDTLSFIQISAMLRLGHKYSFRSYRAEALERFLDAFGPDWDTIMVTDDGTIDTERMHMDDSHSWSDVVNLAYDLRLNQALPLIYFNAIAHTSYPAYLFEGTKSNNGRISYVHEDIRRHLICTQNNLYAALRRHTFSWMFTPIGDSDCDCWDFLLGLISQTYTPRLDVAKALGVWDEVECQGLCSECRTAAQASFEHGRDNLWDALPSVFGLPSWDVLEASLEELD
ncbi:hypothetical protein DFP72DRAFT_818896 [Ephemerocybe angulata]|uniref:BTB domain-containing protein n=1 Tax=Ephemerocybe angulata TaxID=980116 RepID=A0A8H6HPG4_9AGAR|nr:hypothetical protein DFP72DRAFT_818896 [Tulosesus angulatus]